MKENDASHLQPRLSDALFVPDVKERVVGRVRHQRDEIWKRLIRCVSKMITSASYFQYAIL